MERNNIIMKDCKKCNQTTENCECHIPDEVKHKGLHDFCESLKDDCTYTKKELQKIFKDRLNHLQSEVKGVTSVKLTKRFDLQTLSKLNIQIEELMWMKNKLKL